MSAQTTSPDPYDQCSTIANAKKRLECFDDIQRARGHAPAPEAVKAEERRAFGRPSEERAAAPAAQAQVEAESADAVTVELADVGVAHDGRIWIKTSDGAIWAQTDTTLVHNPPAIGSSIEIKRASVGSYLCAMTRWLQVRCVRADSAPQ